MEVVGETVDDAVGEAFDKSAKLLGLPYPGGPLIDDLAKTGDPYVFDFPKSDIPDLNFSFSWIKTAILYFLRDRIKEDPEFIKKELNNLAASIQRVLIEMLMEKLFKAARKYGIVEVAIAGGVSANSALRSKLKELANENGWKVFIPEFQYCTDNAGMIAMAAHFKYQESDFASLDSVPDPRFKF
jgi:N6-L-threonylcarbamoyladenine synthase